MKTTQVRHRSARCALGLTALLLGAGCGSSRSARTEAAPTTLVEAEAAIRTAENLGARANPEAARHLELARVEVRRAHALWDDGKKVEATLAVQRAEADAALATALAQEAPAREEAQAAQREVEALESGGVR